jgi:DNA processing protein
MGDHRRTVREILSLARVPGIGPARLRALLEHFTDSGAILRATVRDLICVPGIEHKTALTIASFFRNGIPAETTAFVDEQIARMDLAGAAFVHILEEHYPPHLRTIYDPPAFLFMHGTLEPQDAAGIAIVGTRDPDTYGKRIAEVFAAGLAGRGITVVSGLARGIDTLAHTAALQAGGRTIAVIGSGLDVPYPAENIHLFRRIREHGAVLSEFAMGAKPDAVSFPQRNRVVSGMTLGTLVIQTRVDGGAMITARLALDQNREVFAIPSPVTGNGRSGTNLLLREGRALLTETVDDIITELGPKLQGLITTIPTPPVQDAPSLSLFEQHVFDVLGTDPLHIDAIAERTSLTTADALVRLLGLECKSVVRQLPGKHFIRL